MEAVGCDMTNEPPRDDDSSIEQLRLVIDANQSIKHSILSCMLVRAIQRPREHGRGRKAFYALVIPPAAFVTVHFWPALVALVGHLGG